MSLKPLGKIALKIHILLLSFFYDLSLLFSGKISLRAFFYGIRKQLLLSAIMSDAKYARVGRKYFVNPFAPYFPGKYFNKMLENNSNMKYPLRPNYAQIAITNACPCECFHCHVINTQDRSKDLSRELVFNTIDEMIDADFPVIFFVGGEPMSRFDDLVDFVRHASKGMETRIFSSGMGMSIQRLKLLKEAGLEGICVSLDHYKEEVHNAQRRNNKAFEKAIFTIKEASRMGFYVSAVCCTSGDMARNGEYKKVVDLAESLGAHSIQLNEIRPVGRAGESKQPGLFLDKGARELLIDYYKTQNKGNRKIAIVMPWYNEEPEKLGCMATAGQTVHVDSQGNVQPCVLLDVGLGNINEQSFKEIWDRFTPLCKLPVRECIIHSLRDKIEQSDTKLLSPGETLNLWPEFSKMEPSDLYKKMRVIK